MYEGREIGEGDDGGVERERERERERCSSNSN
jgi:hypothetical protein